MSDRKVIEAIEELVRRNPMHFDSGIKGLTPLELAYLKLTEGLLMHALASIDGMELLVAPGPIIETDDKSH